MTGEAANGLQWVTGIIAIIGAVGGAAVGGVMVFLGNYSVSRAQQKWNEQKVLRDRKAEGYAKSIRFLIRSIPTTVELSGTKYMLEKDEYLGRMQSIMEAQLYMVWLQFHTCGDFQRRIGVQKDAFWRAVDTVRRNGPVEIHYEGKTVLARDAGELPEAIDQALEVVLDCTKADLVK